jgi:hypothetical protein
MKNKWLLIVLGAFLLSCSSAKIIPFSSVKTPKSPDYSKNESWAVLPGQYPESLSELLGPTSDKEVDVFFIYPTLFSDKKDPAWNADIYRSDIREEVVTLSVRIRLRHSQMQVIFMYPFTDKPTIRYSTTN